MIEASFPWWAWLALGLVLLLFETLTPGGFYVFFFGAGAIVVGVLTLLGIVARSSSGCGPASRAGSSTRWSARWPRLATRSPAAAGSIGKIDLDRTFEERTNINVAVVSALDKASEPWGVKVLRYEIKNITPPQDILAAMEKQMRAEREKRALVLTSKGQRDAAINTAEGEKQKVIKASEATRQRQINEAEGQASAILAVARATAEGLRMVAQSIAGPGGFEAVQLRVAEQYVTQFGNLARTNNAMIVPTDLAHPAALVATAMSVIKNAKLPPTP